jgi:hypothetical protein
MQLSVVLTYISAAPGNKHSQLNSTQTSELTYLWQQYSATTPDQKWVSEGDAPDLSNYSAERGLLQDLAALAGQDSAHTIKLEPIFNHLIFGLNHCEWSNGSLNYRSHLRLATIVLYIRNIPRGIDNTYGARRRGRRRVHAEGSTDSN